MQTTCCHLLSDEAVLKGRASQTMGRNPIWGRERNRLDKPDKCFCKLMVRLHVSLTSRLSIKGRLENNFLKMGPQKKKVWEALL